MRSIKSVVVAALGAFWIMGFVSELNSARATTTYLLISLLLLALMALIRPTTSTGPNK
jgi:hypothetical protein